MGANTLTDRCVVPGAGAFEIAAAEHLDTFKRTIKGKARLGVEIFAQALMVVPKTLTENSGLDVMDCILRAQGAHAENKTPVGIDVLTGEPCSPVMEGIYDNYCVMKQFTSTGYRTFTIFASFLLPVKLPDLFFKHRQALSGEYKEVDPDS